MPFICIPLERERQNIFAFEWEDPETGCKSQYTWTALSQGFNNSPTIFGNPLAKELETWTRKHKTGTVLQYGDAIFIATVTWEECLQLTMDLLKFPGLNG